jgi:hypothetical protein
MTIIRFQRLLMVASHLVGRVRRRDGTSPSYVETSIDKGPTWIIIFNQQYHIGAVMKRQWIISLLLLSQCLWATEFKLEQRELTVGESRAFSSVSVPTAYVVPLPPSFIKAETQPHSAAPLYGLLTFSKTEFWAFRLDESKGTGSGYDQLVIDRNTNLDLKDDQVFNRVNGPDTHTQGVVPWVFGPIPGPVTRRTGNWSPHCYAEVTLGSRPTNLAPVGSVKGLLRLRPASALETTVHWGNWSRKVALVNGNCNFHLGLALRDPQSMVRNPLQPVFSRGDFLLVDWNGSGGFETAAREIAPLSSAFYLNRTAFLLMLSPDLSALRLEPVQQVLERQARMSASETLVKPRVRLAVGGGYATSVLNRSATCPPSSPG